jgi:hypothetical protein
MMVQCDIFLTLMLRCNMKKQRTAKLSLPKDSKRPQIPDTHLFALAGAASV